MKRLKLAEENDETYVYHNTYECYRNFVHSNNLHKLKKKIEQPTITEITPLPGPSGDGPTAKVLRRSITHQDTADQDDTIDPIYIRCVCCGQDKITVKEVKHSIKSPISTHAAAALFLQQTQFLKDDTYTRVADLTTVGAILAANLFRHRVCITRYNNKYRNALCDRSGKQPFQSSVSSVKWDLFRTVMIDVKDYIEEGYGFTIADICLSMYNISDNLDFKIYNRDVKEMLLQEYGEKIQFACNPRKNESDLVFSSNIKAADIAIKLHNLDIIKQAGEILNHAAMKVDYGLEDKVCDASELRKSWNDTHIPDEWLTFYSAVDRVPKSTIARVNEIQLIPGADDAKVNSDDEEENEGVLCGDDISRKCEQIKCQFQIHYYQIHGGRKTVPLQTLVGQSEYAKTRSKEAITLHNRLGTSESYKKVKKRRDIMKQYTIKKQTKMESLYQVTFLIMGGLLRL